MNNNSKITCDSPQQGMLSVVEAQQRILDQVTALTETETVPIKEAVDRVLAEPVRARVDIPGFDNSAMDGYAVNSETFSKGEKVSLDVVGESFAGIPYTGAPVATNQAVRIMTGALIPEGCDAVIMQEQVNRDGDSIEIDNDHCKGENIRNRGEDVKTGQTVLEPGKLLKPADIGLLAAVGCPEVKVHRKIRVAFFSTGDELRSVGKSLAEGQIYDSNRYLLHSMLSGLNVEIHDLGVIEDDKAAITKALKTAAADMDVILTSGGVSVGDADYVKQVLDEIGTINFWRVAMKPGKPLAIGTIGDCYFFGLPGNPVSVFATFYQFVLAALFKLAGSEMPAPVTLKARCTAPLRKAPGRFEFQRGILSYNENGEPEVRPSGSQGSHMLRALSEANCFILLSAENAGVEADEMVAVQPFGV